MQNWLMRAFTRFHAWIFNATNGKVLGTLQGAPVLTLTVHGRKTGRVRSVPLLYVPDGARYVIVASKAGSPTNPDWFENLIVDPNASIQVGDKVIQVTPEIVAGEERERLWDEAVRIYPTYNDYAEKTTREIPVVALTARR